MARQTTNYRVYLKSKQAETGFARLNSKALAVAGAFAGGAVAVLGIGAALNNAMNKAVKYAEAQARLTAVVKATGQEQRFNVRLINEQAKALSVLSGVTRDQVITGTAMLTSFNLTDESVSKLMPAMADMSAFLGTNMKDSALLMGKAMTVGASALSRVGVTLSDVQKEAFNAAEGVDKAALLAEILGQNFGGAAEKINKADQGFANLQVAVDEALVPLGEVVKVKVGEWASFATEKITILTDAFKEYFELDGSQASKLNSLNKIADETQIATEKLKKLKKTLQGLREFDADQTATGAAAADVAKMFGFIAKSGEDVGDVMFRAQFEIQRIGENLKKMKGEADKVHGGKFGGGDNAAKAALKQLADEEAAKKAREEAAKKARIAAVKAAAADAAEKKKWRGEEVADAFAAQEKKNQKNIWLSEQNKLIALEQRDFSESIEGKKQNQLIKIHKSALEKRKKLADEAAEEEKARVREGINIAQNSAGIAIGIAQTLANDIATGQENAAERALGAALSQYGGQLVGLGTKAAFEGSAMLIASGGTDPRGYGLVALGGAAIAAGVGMGAAGAAVNASISGGSAAAGNSGGSVNSNINTDSNSQRESGSSTGAGDGKQVIIINSNAPIFGDIRPTLNSWSRAKRKSERFSLRTV